MRSMSIDQAMNPQRFTAAATITNVLCVRDIWIDRSACPRRLKVDGNDCAEVAAEYWQQQQSQSCRLGLGHAFVHHLPSNASAQEMKPLTQPSRSKTCSVMWKPSSLSEPASTMCGKERNPC